MNKLHILDFLRFFGKRQAFRKQTPDTHRSVVKNVKT